MSNNWAAVVPQLLAQGLTALRENAIMPRLVNRGYEALAGQRGSTITIPIPSSIAAVAVSPAITPPANTDSAPTSATVELDQWYEAPFYLTDKEEKEVMAGTIPMQASSAIKAIANKMDQSILTLGKKFYGYVGTAGTTPFGVDTSAHPNESPITDAVQLRKVLNKQLCPLEDRYVVMDADAEANALMVRAFHDMSFSGDPGAILEGRINRRLGFGWFMDQNTQTFTNGAATGYQTNSASLAIGDKTVAVDTGSGAFAEGTIITFAGHTQTYVVTATSAAPATTISIEPGLVVAVGDNVAITAKASHVMNLGFHRDAFAFVTRPLIAHGAGLGVVSESIADPVSGLTLRLEVTHQHKQIRYSFDALWGVGVPRRELGARLAG